MEKSKPRFNYAFLILIGTCFLYAGGLGGILDAAGVFFVPVCKDLGFARGDIAMYLSVYLLSSVFVMPFVGNVLSKYNIRVVMSTAFILTAAAVALMGTYTQAWQWWASGVVFGVAGSFIFLIPGPILIANWFVKRKGLFLGIAAASSGVGAAVLTPIYTLLIEALGWRSAYFAMAIILCVLVLPWTLFVFRFKPSDMGLKPYGFDPEKDLNAQGEYKERGVPYKKGVRSFSFICIFFFTGFIAYFAGFNLHLPGFANSIGYDALFGASLVSAASIGSIFDKLIFGFLNDKIGIRRTTYIELSLITIGFLGFIFCEGQVALVCAAILFGTQTSLYSVNEPLIVQSIFGLKDYPRLISMARVGTGVIGCLGPITVGYLYDYTGSYIPSFFVGIGICVIAGTLMTLGFRAGKKLTWEE